MLQTDLMGLKPLPVDPGLPHMHVTEDLCRIEVNENVLIC